MAKQEKPFPDVLTIGALMIPIQQRNPFDFPESVAMFLAPQYEIHIAEGIPEDVAINLIFHEWSEAINMHYNLELEHWKINLIGNAVFELLRNNDIYLYRKEG